MRELIEKLLAELKESTELLAEYADEPFFNRRASAQLMKNLELIAEIEGE